MEATEGLSVKSIEQQAVAREASQQAETAAKANLDKLRESFKKAGDEVNLLWLDYSLEGETDLQKMATRSGRNAEEFYRALDRRKRHVKRLLAESNGVTNEEEP